MTGISGALVQIVLTAALGMIAGYAAGRQAAAQRARDFAREWERARQDKAATETVSLIHDAATRLARAAHVMWWVTWRAAHDREALNPESLAKFEWEFHELLPQIVGAHAALRAMNPASADQIETPVARLHHLCGQISEAAIPARRGEFGPLAGCLEETRAYKEGLEASLKGASERVLARYGTAAEAQSPAAGAR